MLRLQQTEFADAVDKLIASGQKLNNLRHVSIVTGRLAYPYIVRMAEKLEEIEPMLKADVYAIRNDFFGELITVSGLLTAQDIMAQLKGKDLGDIMFLPQNALRAGEDVFLDDIHLPEVERTLQVKTDIVKSSGYDFVSAITGLSLE